MSAARVSTLDGAFLRMETPAAHMHVAWRGRLRPAVGRPRPRVEAIREAIAARLALVPRFRQRLHSPLGCLGEPAWVDDVCFDVARHVTLLSDPVAPVTDEAFAALTDAVLSVPLARDRPLWQAYLAPRLTNGDAGLVVKMHHALVDGRSAVTVGLLLFDLEPDPPRFPSETWEPAPPPGRTRFALESMRSVVTTPLRGARAARGVVPGLRALGDESMHLARSSSLNGDIGPRRTLVGHRLDLGDVARVKRAHDVTHNDVCLAVVASALRELEVAAGRAPRPVKAMVPVSVRCDDDAGTLGNRISFAFVDLPLHQASGALRLKGIHAVTAAFKRARRPAGVAALFGAADAVPPLLRGPLVRALAGPRTHNLVVSNVPGPEHPLYVLGAELLDAYPVVPLSEGHALAIGAFTYRGAVHIGLYADPEALPGVIDLPGALDRGLAGLLPARPVRTDRPGRPSIAAAVR